MADRAPPDPAATLVPVKTTDVLGVLAVVALAVVWIVSPGATVLLIGALIGGLGLAAWVAGKLRI